MLDVLSLWSAVETSGSFRAVAAAYSELAAVLAPYAARSRPLNIDGHCP
jgi:hypothetical protein